MKTAAGKHRRRKVFGTLTPLGLVAVGWLGMGVVPGAGPSTTTANLRPGSTDSTVLGAPTYPAVGSAPATSQQLGQAGDPGLRLAAAKRSGLLDTASSSDIPSGALAAYQRAAMVIDASDKGCHLDWTLLAAIGKVESDHGRTSSGRDSAGDIYGPVLDGKHHTAKVADTDGGKLDGNQRWDRAVGPMQFLPSTWSVVGVDGNADGKRDPQNLTDAALGAAVYLCGNNEDLGTRAGQRAAVLRYNHSQSYVDLVLSISHSYLVSAPVSTAVVPHAMQIGGPTEPSTTTGVTRHPGSHASKTKSTKKTTKTTTKKTSGTTKPQPWNPKLPTAGSSPSNPGSGSSGSTKVTLAKLAGLSLDAAGQALVHSGLKPGVVTYVYSAAIPADQVISTATPAGTQVKPGRSIAMTVSLGAVPDLPAGSDEAEARTFFAQLAHPITVADTVTHDHSATVAAGDVISVVRESDDDAVTTVVALVISDGPGPA